MVREELKAQIDELMRQYADEEIDGATYQQKMMELTTFAQKERLPITGNYPVVRSLCMFIGLCIDLPADPHRTGPHPKTQSDSCAPDRL